MLDAMFVLCVALVQASVTLFAGRGLATILRVSWLRRGSLESVCAWLLLGTGWFILVFGWLSYLGMPARIAAPLIFLGSLGLGLIGLFGQYRRTGRLLPLWVAAPGRGWLTANRCFLAVYACCLAIFVRQSVEYQWVRPYCDTLHYVTNSHHLQDHGFGFKNPDDLDHPNDLFLSWNQIGNMRMGSYWLLAQVQALSGREALSASIPLMAHAVLLHLAGVWLLARWGCRLAWRPAAVALVCVGCPCAPLMHSIAMGFQSQPFGLAYLLGSLAVLARILTPMRWTTGSGCVLAVFTASLLSVYNEVAPFLAIPAFAVVGFLLFRGWRVGQLRRVVFFATMTILFLIALGNLEWYRAVCNLRTLVGVKVGYAITFNKINFLFLALGVHPFPHSLRGVGWLVAVPGLFLLVGVLVGWLVLIRRRLWVVPAALAMFAVTATYYGLFCLDPFTGYRGHTWSLFKLCGWSTAMFVLVAVTGLSWLSARSRRWRFAWLFPLLGPAIFLVSIKGGMFSQPSSDQVQLAFATCRPRQELAQLRAYMAEHRYESYCYVDSQKIVLQPILAAHLFYPTPAVLDKDWPFRWDHLPMATSVRSCNARTLVVCWNNPPFEPATEKLPLGFRRLDPSRPWLYQLIRNGKTFCHETESNALGDGVHLSAEPLELVLWSAHPTQTRLVLHLESKAQDVSQSATVEVSDAAEKWKNKIVVCGNSRSVIPLSLPGGRYRLLLRGPADVVLRSARFRSGSGPENNAVRNLAPGWHRE